MHGQGDKLSTEAISQQTNHRVCDQHYESIAVLLAELLKLRGIDEIGDSPLCCCDRLPFHS